jgi:hypothetical protein
LRLGQVDTDIMEELGCIGDICAQLQAGDGSFSAALEQRNQRTSSGTQFGCQPPSWREKSDAIKSTA